MRHRPFAAAAPAAVLALSFTVALTVGPAAAPAGRYTFRNVADTGDGRFVAFGQDPAVNDAGTVAYAAVRPEGGRALFAVAVDGSATQLDAVDDLGFLGEPSINDAGEVVFEVALTAGGTAVLRGSAPGAVETVIDDAGPFGLFGFPRVNNAGTVATSARFDDGRSGIVLVGRGGAVTVVADDAGPYNLFDEPAVNDSGAVAFQASDDSARAGVFTGPDPVADAVAREQDGYSFPNAGGAVDINNAAAVAFLAVALDRANPDLPTPEEGIFTGPDPDADKVVRVGDALFGSTVTDVSFSPGGLSDRGEVAFSYALADGRTGVAAATPIPLPAALPAAAALTSLAVLVPAGWRRLRGLWCFVMRAPPSNTTVEKTERQRRSHLRWP